MYVTYWQLAQKPFENTPDPKFLFDSPQHREGLSRLLYVVREGKGAGLLTGTYGCGKTLLANALFKELEKDVYRVAFVTNPRLDDTEILRMIVHLLGGPSGSSGGPGGSGGADVPPRKADALMALEGIFRANAREGRKTVVVVDEAHAIESDSIFEELRLLLNYQTDSQYLVTLLLLGQPELKNKVEFNKQLNQRIALRYDLQAFNPFETAQYVKHRLAVAGAKRELFEETALQLLHERSGGIPRRINQIADMALLTGMGRKASVINADIVREAIESLSC